MYNYFFEGFSIIGRFERPNEFFNDILIIEGCTFIRAVMRFIGEVIYGIIAEMMIEIHMELIWG